MIRNARPHDFDRIAELASLIESQPVTGDTLRDRDQTFGNDAILRRIVAVDAGRTVGCASLNRKPHYELGIFWMDLVVDLSERGRGVGSALVDAVESTVRSHGGTSLRLGVNDQEEGPFAFAEKRGFRKVGHEFGGEISPSEFDTSPYAALLDRLGADGITFVPLSELPHESRQELHAMNNLLANDSRPYDQFERDVYGAHWFFAEGQILALKEGRMIGLHALGATAEGELYTMFTGVREEFRGRGIATALKVKGLQFAKERGTRRVVTDNDSENAPMLAINRKLGFRPLPGSIQIRKDL